MSDGVVRLGVVGLGQGLLDVYVGLHHPRVCVVAVSDPDPRPHQWITGTEMPEDLPGPPFRQGWLRQIQQHPERTEIDYVADYPDLLRRDDIDAIALVVPNELHEPLTVAALEAGKFVLCTKPMAHDVPSALRIADAARRHPGRYMLGFQLTYSPLTQTLRSALPRLGTLRQIRLDHHREPWPATHRCKSAPVDGAIIREGTHFLDLLYRLSGQRPWISVAGFGGTDRFPGELEFEDNAVLALDYDGFRALHGYSHIRAAQPKEDILLVGEAGTIRGSFSRLRLETDDEERIIDVPDSRLPDEFLIGYSDMYDEFVKMCRDGTEPYSNWQTAAENMLTCFAAQRAVAEARTIHRDELRDLDWRTRA